MFAFCTLVAASRMLSNYTFEDVECMQRALGKIEDASVAMQCTALERSHMFRKLDQVLVQLSSLVAHVESESWFRLEK